MQRFLAATIIYILFTPLPVVAITIDTVFVGDVGNANDLADGDSKTPGVQNFGAVNYAFHIGTTEVTVGQYAAFLNAVAATDTYGLYYIQMTTDLRGAGIARNGVSGSYTYTVIGSANKPIAAVSWSDAARFSNWLHNGQPTGTEGPGTTETGAYTLTGKVTDEDFNSVSRNSGARWFLPSENEWYKAAYYQPASQGGDTDNYWAYPMRTNNTPFSDQPPGDTPDNTRVGNFQNNDGVANGYDDGLAVTGLVNQNQNQNYLTDVGAYALSPGPYGTFDQGGNVMEYTEGISTTALTHLGCFDGMGEVMR